MKTMPHYQLQSNQQLVIYDEVLTYITKYRQLRFWHREAGGQLFARISDGLIEIVKATGPRKRDKRSRFWYVAHRPSEQFEIDECYRQGLHFIGDWHTHPEDSPTPSDVDMQSWQEMFSLSEHDLIGMVFIIVGKCLSEEGLWVGLYCNSQFSQLRQVETEPDLASMYYSRTHAPPDSQARW